MTPSPSPKQRIPWPRIIAEGAAIVVSILLAFGIQAWWEARSDRALELHLLEGFELDVTRDTFDIRASMDAAQGRAAGADELLVLIGDPIAGQLPESPPGAAYPGGGDPAVWLARARERFPTGSIDAPTAFHMVVSLGSIQTIGLSTATYSEATASGQLDVIRDEDVRSLITNYYFRAGQFIPADQRAERHWEELRAIAAEVGLAVTGDASDAEVRRALDSDRLVAELKNARDLAAFQLVSSEVVLSAALQVLDQVKSAIQARGADR